MFEQLHIDKKIMDYSHVDIRNETLLKTVLDVNKTDIVFHLAAQPIMRKSINEPVLTFGTNLMGTVNILEAIRNSNSVKASVLITSDKCYENNPKPNGYKEDDRLGGDDPYSASKACAELAINAYRSSYGLNVASTRAGNIIGGGDWGQDRLLPDCIRKLSSGEKIVIRNPSYLRPWQYVLDPLYGYLMLGKELLEGNKIFATAWNFGPPKENYICVEELVKKVIDLWNSGEYTIQNANIPESKFLRLNTDFTNNVLGWIPKYKIDDALKETISWYKRFYDGKDMYNFTVSQIKKYMEE